VDPVVGAYLADWRHLLIRWLHLGAAIAWVGASFYFIALDRSLRPPAGGERPLIGGEAWEIHGGGFYRIEKFKVAPASLPDALRWFKWEAYLTWLSGFALLVILYYLDPTTYLIDPLVAPLEPWQAVGASVLLLAIGWVVYDQLSRRLETRQRALAVILCVLIALVAWGSSQIFSARASYIQVGAMLGTWMAANVFFVIIPGQRELVAAAAAGRAPDPGPGIRGKQRSVHNNYLTLPTLFAMISQHFPLTYGSDQRWAVLLALMAVGVLAQHLLNERHDGRVSWPLVAGTFAIVALVAVALAPIQVTGAALTAADFPAVSAVVTQRCVVCHSAAPSYPGILAAPKGVTFDTAQQMQAASRRMYQMAVVSKLMPLNNITGMTAGERDLIARWVRSGAPIP
jgi:uncharacterized membrane protein